MSDVGSILGLIALVGVIIAVGGIALIGFSLSQNRPIRGGILVVIIGVAIAILFNIVIVVEPTQVAIVVNTLSGTVEQPARGGVHIIVPLFQHVAQYYPITQQEYTMAAAATEGARAGDDSIEAQSKDGQLVKLDITVLYRVIPDEADALYQDLQDTYVDSYVRPISRALIRQVISQFTAEEVFGVKRAELPTDMKAAITDPFKAKHLELVDVLVRAITFSDEFTTSIEKKVVALQDLERAKTEATTAQTQAKGKADAAIEAARGEAESVRLRAIAQAEALRVVSEQIAANPLLIQYLYVTNLSDNVSLVLVPSNSAFLFDPTKLPQGNANFTAPAVPTEVPGATETPTSP